MVFLSSAQAVLIITIAPDGSGNARMLVTGSGSTTSTTQGNWDTAGGVTSSYTNQDFEIDGFKVTTGTQTRTLNRFSFNDDSPRSGGFHGDDFSMGFGDGTGVGVISVLDNVWQTIRFRNDNPFSATADEALVSIGNFNEGIYRSLNDTDNFFWGGSFAQGITLIISSDAIPEPTSALLLLLPATALLKRKRFC